MDQNYWRSFKELYSNDSFQAANKNEFAENASESPDLAVMNEVSRRKFMGLMTASAALAGTACSNYRDEGELIPHNHQTETTTPGKTYHYASNVNRNGVAHPVLLKVREGRPIKVNGNSEHPGRKAPPANVQAMLMSLYDPERLKRPLKSGVRATWELVQTEISTAVSSAVQSNKKVVVLGNKQISPSFGKMISNFKESGADVSYVAFENADKDNSLKAWKMAYGTAQPKRINLSKTEVVVSFDDDFLGAEGTSQEEAEYASTRSIVDDKKLSKLITVEADFSITGMNSDKRVPVKADQVEWILLSVLSELIEKEESIKNEIDAALLNKVAAYRAKLVEPKIDVSASEIKSLVNELYNAKGKAAVRVGKKLSTSAHIAGLMINSLLKSPVTSKYAQLANLLVTEEELELLLNDLNSGNVGVLINLNSNPVYNLSSDYKFSDAIKKAGMSVSLVESENETSVLCNYALAINHPFESWGDGSDQNGVVNLQQPLIAPVFKTRQAEDLLISWFTSSAYSDTAYREFLKSNWKQDVRSQASSSLSEVDFWNTSLHDGFAKYKVSEEELSFDYTSLNSLSLKPVSKGIVLAVNASKLLGDGFYSNIGWLQEVPNPISKLSWDNVALISINTMKKLGLRPYPTQGDYSYELVKVEVDGKSVEIPAFTQPGIPDDQIIIEFGYGREVAGIVAKGVGVNASKLLSKGETPFVMTDVKVTKTGTLQELASAQEHNAIIAENMESNPILSTEIEDAHLKRMIIQEGTLAEYQADENFLHAHKHYPKDSMNRPHKYEGVKWSMAIDLNKCTGCTDCVIACNVENNIPVVGKDMAKIGREMHWMRIDRYYSGSPENPKASVQPMLCQHCDNAPCENVCPVVATTHSPEGINEMTYNRCVGTRYCANNCPYKVRRFNFYDFRSHFAEELQKKPVLALAHNPEVTVRSRGVMEKCTFCVQRVNSARAESKRNKEEWIGQGVTAACQEVCSANAISFGNINDVDADVARLKKHELTYRVLDETGVESNVRYLAKIRNTEGKSH